jgi:DNA-binding NarL/FixJ family response regulator
MIKVCIIEDIHEIREGFKSVLNLSTDFYCAGDFSNAEDAIIGISEINPEIIIIDINLPGMNGIDAIAKLKDKESHTQFLVFTVYDDDEMIFKAIQAGASGYLLKKTTPEKFLHALKELYEGGSPMSPTIARKVINSFKPGLRTNDVLTIRETEILTLLSKGLLYKEISSKLNISIGTVKQHIHKIYEKLHVQNRTEAINKFLNK